MLKNHRLLFSIMIAFTVLFASCSGTSDKATNNQKEKTLEEGVEIIDLETFKAKVWDFTTHPKTFVLENDIPVVVDFYADWCKPCKITSPIIEELAEEYAGRVQFYKVNTDQQRELSSVFGIQSIPSFLWAPKEGQPQMTAGIARTPEETKAMFRKQIDEFILKTK